MVLFLESELSLRQERVADQIRDVIASCFQGGKLGDPRLSGVTVTKVKVSRDMQLASVSYRLYHGSEDSHKEVGGLLMGAAPVFRRLMSQQLKLRRVPSLRFFYDRALDDLNNIENLLTQI